HVIVFAPFYIALSSLLSAALFLYVLCYDLVVNVCKIRYIIYFITSVLHISADCIEDDHRPGISNMDKVIDRRSAYIHFHFSFFQRNEFFFSLCQGIIDFHFLLLFSLLFLIAVCALLQPFLWLCGTALLFPSYPGAHSSSSGFQSADAHFLSEVYGYHPM